MSGAPDAPPGRTYAFPPGGLPDQGQDPGASGAVFTAAYAFIPACVQRDIVTSAFPGWIGTRAWVLARPLTGFAETFAQYIMEVGPGGGSERPEPDPEPAPGGRVESPNQPSGVRPMAWWAGLVALALGLAAILGMEPNPTAILRGLVELAGVLGVFALICMTEARQQ